MMPVDVFLGGACNPTTWRTDAAVPFLEERGLSYFNPQVDEWQPDLILEERKAKSESHLLLFVFDTCKTRCISTMVEVAYLLGHASNLVLVVMPNDHCVLPVINGEQLSGREHVCIQAALHLLIKLATLNGVPVFHDLSQALLHTAEHFTNAHSSQVCTRSPVKQRIDNHISPQHSPSPKERKVTNCEQEVSVITNFLDHCPDICERTDREIINVPLNEDLWVKDNQVIHICARAYNLRLMIRAAYAIGSRVSVVLCVNFFPSGGISVTHEPTSPQPLSKSSSIESPTDSGIMLESFQKTKSISSGTCSEYSSSSDFTSTGDICEQYLVSSEALDRDEITSLSAEAAKDHNRGRAYLQDIAETCC